MPEVEFADPGLLYAPHKGEVLQVDLLGRGVEFGQKLRIGDSPTFEGLSILASFTVECLAVLNNGLLVKNDAIFLGTLDACGALNVNDKIITLNNIDTPDDLTADGGGIVVLAGPTGGDKTILWRNIIDVWALNQSVAVQKQLVVGGVAAPPPEASIDLRATDKALLLNPLTTVQRDALPATPRMVIYNTDISDVEFFDGAVWKSMGGRPAVNGPASSVDNAVMRFDGVSGKLVQNSSVIIDDAGNVVIPGDLTVQGTTITLDSTTLLIEDKNIELGNVATPTNITADGGGITLKGTTDKTIKWIDATKAWTFNEDIDALTNIIRTTGVVTGGFVIGITSVFGGNILLSGNTISSANANGDILLIPNGTGGILIGNGTGVVKITDQLIIEGSTSQLLLNDTDNDKTYILKSNLGDFSIVEIGGNNVFKIRTGAAVNSLDINSTEVTIGTKLIVDNLSLDGNTISSTDLNGNINFSPNGTGKVQIDDLISAAGGVFKFTDDAIQAGLDAVEFVEMGHGGGNGFINAVGDGGLDFRFEGATLATFTDFGHLHLLTNVDQKHTLKIVTANNLNDTGIAWENSGGSFTHTIFRTDVGANRADLVFAAGQNVDIDLLTNSFKIHGGAGVEGKLEILSALQISSGSPALGKVWTSDAAGLGTWEEDLGTVIAQETFASTNVRFFGELALPAAQGWTDTATGPATIDLQTQLVFGVSKQVVRHNDDVTNGATTSKITLTAQNWIDVNNFGASYSGISRLDTVDGVNGFFSGLQANAAENPLATGNRRYGIFFNSNAGNLRLGEPDGGVDVDLDGTGGNPLILFDEWFSWECVVPAGLGAAQFFVNGILTTFAPEFRVNIGGLGTTIQVGSGSTGGANRIVYHDNFGVTIFEDSATKTLTSATMEADIAQVNIPEGKRDYIIILPDGNPRELGSIFRVVANNLFGKITLQNQNPVTPEILYNGLRTLVIDVFVKEIIEGINTVNQGNVYLGFKDEDIDRAESIFAQLSSSVDQVPGDTNPTVITYNIQDEINGIGHSTSLNPGELEILPGFGGVYFVSPQAQVGKDSGGVKTDFDMFWQIDRGSGFVDEANSNIKLTIKDSDITDVIVSGFNIPLKVGDKIRMLQRVSNSTVGLGLKNTDPVVGPPTRPRVPSIILAMHRVGGI